jgi:hypothetical protein
MPVQQLRFAFAFVLAPVVLSALLCAPLAISGGLTPLWLHVLLLPTLAVTIAHSILLGAPVALRLRKYNSLTLRRALIAGAVIGGVPLTLYALWRGMVVVNGWFGTDNAEFQAAGEGVARELLARLALSVPLALIGSAGAAIWWVLSGASSNHRWRGP